SSRIVELRFNIPAYGCLGEQNGQPAGIDPIGRQSDRIVKVLIRRGKSQFLASAASTTDYWTCDIKVPSQSPVGSRNISFRQKLAHGRGRDPHAFIVKQVDDINGQARLANLPQGICGAGGIFPKSKVSSDHHV